MMTSKLLGASMVALCPMAAMACPSVEVDQDKLNGLFADLRNAQSEMVGRAYNDEIWSIWAKAPDQKSQELLDQGRERIRYGDYDGAEEVLTELIAYCPHYAEGWNQRAFARYLQQDYGRALEDVAQALERNEQHFGAMAGRATILISMGRTKIGHTALREALKLNPWLSERHLLPPGDEI